MGMQGGGGMQQQGVGMQQGGMNMGGYNQMGPQGGKPGYPMQGGEQNSSTHVYIWHAVPCINIILIESHFAFDLIQ